MYKIRAILDTKEDVIRTIVVNNAINLEELHNIVATTFGFNGQEMASFYKSDKDWNQGEEIPLFNMSEFDEGISMKSCMLQEILPSTNDKLIYVYDFFNLWTFYVEVIEISNEKIDAPTILLTVGEVPEKSPEKKFTTTNNADDEDSVDDFFDDDFDFENY